MTFSLNSFALTSGGVQQMLYVNEEYKMRNDGEQIVHRQQYQNLERTIRRFVVSEDKVVTELVTTGGRKLTTFINESGLYALILGSELEERIVTSGHARG